MAAVLLAVHATPAHAGPATLVVSPASPICFTQQMIRQGITQTAAAIYDVSGVAAGGRLIIRDDTAMVKVVDTPVLGIGAQAFAVTFNHVYVVLLLDALQQNDLAPSVKVTTKNCDVPTPCTQNCFTVEHGIKPHGTFAEFNVHASAPALFDIKASKSPPKNGQFAKVDAQVALTSPLTKTWTPNLLGLEPATDTTA
ncbi:MAG: hypothetical protein HYX51_04280 [Chloroflexi bacterium]|nr:hypothetical protein [Chloroflexota bacterium]